MEMATDSSPLCCCEFRNLHGQRTHILAFCCECEELDNAVDQCLKGNRVPREKVTAVCHVISDRIRIPWFDGAKKVGLDVLTPLIFLPTSVYIACYGFVFTVLSLIYVPLFILLYYIYALNQRKQTWFFVSWGLSSVLGIFGLYLVYVAPFCSYLNTTVISVGTGGVLVFYSRVVFSKSRLDQYALISKSSLQNRKSDGDQVFSDLTCCFCTEGPFLRAKHCRICGYCVPRSDHHCVWTNCCIGQHNHQPFIASILLFIITGLYGVYLSFSTVCVSHGSSILHLDCTNIYKDVGSSIVFVASLYTLMFIFAMSSLLLQQLVFISFNLTGDEWRRAFRNKPFWEIIWTHRFNKGVLRNWTEFLLPQDVRTAGEREVV